MKQTKPLKIVAIIALIACSGIFVSVDPAIAATKTPISGNPGTVASSASTLIVGVNYWDGTPVAQFYSRDLPLLKALGVSTVKLGAVYYGGPDNNLDQYSSLVNALISNGFEVTGILQEASVVTNLTQWGQYVTQVVSYFKGRVANWIVWNEPNWNPATGAAWYTPSQYTNILKTAYTSAKSADPNCFVLTGGFLSVEGSISYIQGIYQDGAKGYFDALAIDPYCYPASPLQPNVGAGGHTFWNLPEVRSIMVQYGDSAKEIWINEFGYRSTDAGNWTYSVTQQQQALYLQQALDLTASWSWVARFYIYNWMDSASGGGSWGLIQEDYSPPYLVKPAYTAVQQFISSQSS